MARASREYICCRTTTARDFTLLFCVTFFVIFPIFLYDVKDTFYFTYLNSTAAKFEMRMENTERLMAAQQYLDMLDKTKLHGMLRQYANTTEVIRIALSIVTVSRNRHMIDSYEPMYLTQVVWQLLSKLHRALANGFPYAVEIAICNVDRDPDSYWEAKNLSHFIPSFQRFDKTHFSLVHPLEKEKQDYVFCINTAMQTSDPSYVLLVEDDALPHDDFFAVLERTVSLRVENHYHRGDVVPHHDENVAYIKFYHPDRLLGFFSAGCERLPEFIGIIFLCGPILAGIYHLALNQCNSKINTIWALCSLYTAAVLIAVGRPNVNEWRRVFSPYFYTYTPAPSCCTPAMLFPRGGAENVVEFLSSVTCGKNFGKDSALDQLLRVQDMKAYLVQPSTFTHIGQYSSLREQMVDPFLVE